MDGIPIGHGCGGHSIVRELSNRFQKVFQVRSFIQGLDGGALDNRSIHTRIGIGKAQFDNVNPIVKNDLGSLN